MPTAKLSGLVTRLGRGPDTIESATDADLLQRFAVNRDEIAFAELVRRHGRLVFGVCRRMTNSHHLAEDAFQAVFVVLSAKAASIRPPSAVAAWLHGVACRTALRARTMADRRRRRETLVGDVPDASSREPQEAPDAVAILDEEIARLPDHYRLPVVLCELEGVGRKDAARRLGIAEGTLSSRLAAARKALADRLRSRGVAMSAAGLSALFAQAVSANPPASLTAKAVAVATPASLPAAVAALSQGVLRIMFLNKLKLAVPLAVLAIAFAAYAATAAWPRANVPASTSLAFATTNQPATAKPRPTGASRLIVWRNLELVMIDAEGKNEKVVLSQKLGIHPSMFSVSPDGAKVAVVKPSEDEAERKAHLFIFDAGKEDSGVDLGVAGIAHWSADSKELAVCTFEDAAKPEDVRTTHEMITLATKKRTPIKLPADQLMVDWSRDGNYFLTLKLTGERENRATELFVMNRDGTQHKRFADTKLPFMFSRFSPDATKILAMSVKFKEETPAEKKARDDAGGRPPRPRHELVVIDIATGKVVPVADTPENADLQGFCWSPDGKRIAYVWREHHEGDPKELGQKETVTTLVICDPDGKNQKSVMSEKAEGAFRITLGQVDWQFVAAEKSDAEKFAGAWKIVSVTDGGKESEADGGAMTFAKDKITFQRGNRTMEVTFKLDAAKSPKWIDLTIDGETTLGIYELDGDNLKICLNEDRAGKRPDKFVSEAGTPNDLLFVLKRETP